MWVSPREVYVMANFHGYGFTRGTLIGRQVVYGSSSVFRESRSFCAHGSSGSSGGFSPPSRSMSAFDPPPTHGPVRSTRPSGSRGTGRSASASEIIGVLPVGMEATRSCCNPSAPVGMGAVLPCWTPIAMPRTTTANELTSSFRMSASLPATQSAGGSPCSMGARHSYRLATSYRLRPTDWRLPIRLRRREAAGNPVLVVLQTDELHQIDVRPDVPRREPQLHRP